MNRRISFLDELPAIVQLLLLLFCVGICLLLSVALGYGLVKPIFGIRASEVLGSGTSSTELNKINALKFLQLVSSVGAFILPALIFGYVKNPSGGYMKANKFSKPLLYLIALSIFVVAIPLINFTAELNQKLLSLPSFLKPLFDFLKSLEDKGAEATKALLTMPHFTDMVYNVLLIGLIPAMGEEFLFRGCVQQVLYERSRKIHFSIWLSAAIFSFIHFQFFGFLPRMLLGILLGYLFYYSGSIWVNIFAHAFNNGSQVVAVYLYQKGFISVNIADDTHTPILYVISSLPVLAALVYFLYKNRLNYETPGAEVAPLNEPPPLL